jgi:hypothetical protein
MGLCESVPEWKKAKRHGSSTEQKLDMQIERLVRQGL